MNATVLLNDGTSLALTPRAQSFMRRMLRLGGFGPHAGFRLQVSAGGCSGLSADFDIEREPRPGDASFTIDDLTLFVPTNTFELLAAVIVDFVDSPTQTGFVLFDPKPSSCASEAAKPALVQLDKFGR